MQPSFYISLTAVGGLCAIANYYFLKAKPDPLVLYSSFTHCFTAKRKLFLLECLEVNVL